jgi:hypothetical protein
VTLLGYTTHTDTSEYTRDECILHRFPQSIISATTFAEVSFTVNIGKYQCAALGDTFTTRIIIYYDNIHMVLYSTIYTNINRNVCSITVANNNK